MRRSIGFATAISLVAVMTTACVTTEKISTNQLGDEHLSCSEIKAQDVKLDDVAEKAQSNKGVNTANVAAVLLFWPAAVGNYMDADSAEKLIEKRRTKLATMYASQKCGT